MRIFRKKRRGALAELGLLILLAAMLSWGTGLEKTQQNLSDKLLRLHVLGASDSEEDQRIKEQVRDAVLTAAAPILEKVESKEAAVRALGEALPEISAAANRCLTALGSDDRAAVSLDRTLFGTRVYDRFALPGGWYDALTVTIGEGEGKNWWCVVYPQICTAASLDRQEAVAVMAGFTEEEIGLMEGSTPEYRLKFRSLELLEDLLGWFRGGSGGIPASR